MNIIAIIPSRYESKRFPGKALALINGKPMINRVYEQAQKSKLIDAVYVATDSKAIYDSIVDINGNAIMTSDRCSSGTDRVADAARTLNLDEDDILINIQGDQPILQAECFSELVQPFFDTADLPMATLAHAMHNEDEINDPNNVKVIIDAKGFAIYFSRAKIPFNRDQKESVQYYKHIGIYAYSNAFLQTFTKLPHAPLEDIEKLEQLRAIHNRHKIGVTLTTFDSPSVDDAADIAKIEATLVNGE